MRLRAWAFFQVAILGPSEAPLCINSTPPHAIHARRRGRFQNGGRLLDSLLPLSARSPDLPRLSGWECSFAAAGGNLYSLTGH